MHWNSYRPPSDWVAGLLCVRPTTSGTMPPRQDRFKTVLVNAACLTTRVSAALQNREHFEEGYDREG